MLKSELTLGLVILLSVSLLMSSCTCQMVGDRVENNCYGDVVPCANNTYSLGSPARWWENLYVGNLVGWNITSSSGPVGNVTGVGVAGTIPEWISASALGNSPITHFLGLINFNTHTLTNVVDPLNPQDVATKNYVDSTAGGTGNVTASAIYAPYIPQATSNTNLTNSIISANTTYATVHGGLVASNIYSYGMLQGLSVQSTYPAPNPPMVVASNVMVTNLNADLLDGQHASAFAPSSATGNVTYSQSTSDHVPKWSPAGNLINSTITSNVTYVAISGSIAPTGNITMVPGATVDGVDISTLSAGSGNVTASGMTAGYVPLSTSTTGITNSIMTGNGTILSIPIVTGAELCPTIAAANWTAGAGWTVGVGTLTRVASAVTTAYPTVAIVPSITANYLVTFTISGWTAGTVTMTFGGVDSTAFQGNQNVYLYVSPYTTGNIIFTPTATFAGVISVVSVKAYTGGEIYIDGGVLYYDSRGHPNRLSHVTRHLSEMQTDTLLDKSRSTLTCSGGVLTYTLYAVYGQGTWNFNGVVYAGAVASANVTLTGGTDAVPKTNWVYFDLDGNTPRLAASTTAEPTTTHIMVAEFIVGAVSGSSYTIYGYNRARTEVDSFVKRVIGRLENSGSLYLEGALPTVTSTTLSIASGGKWYQGIFEMTAANTVTVAGGYYYIKNGAYATATTLAPLLFYSDGTAVGGKKFTNIIWGIVPTTTTASGTLPTTVKLVACLQMNPVAEYSTLAEARQDLYDSSSYYPPDQQLKEIFVPIARTIIKEGGTTVFQLLDTGIYWRDLRGVVSSGGGAAPVADAAIKYALQVQAAAQAVTTDSQTLYWGSQQVAPSTTADRWRVYIPKTGTIRSAYIYSYAGTAGTNSAWSMYIRLNNTSDTLIQTLGANTNDRVWSSAALDIAVTAGDYIEMKEVQPAWGTNPADVTRTGVVYVE